MTQKLERTILPELCISMNFDVDPPKKCKSCTNSPRTMPETPLGGFKWFGFSKEDSTPTNKNTAEIPENPMQQKLKGLEEIGLFSEFNFTKNLKSHCEKDENSIRRPTIHITDFMMNGNKRSMLKHTGGWDAYFSKKQGYQKELLLRESSIKKFFHHTEKKPEFFYSTPPLSPKCPSGLKGSKEELPAISNKGMIIDHIIEKCDQAMMLKPPKVLPKSTSPRNGNSESEKKLKKIKLKMVEDRQ